MLPIFRVLPQIRPLSLKYSDGIAGSGHDRKSVDQRAEKVPYGDALAQRGDPRFCAGAWYLPDEPLLGFVEIPVGLFLMGSDKAHDPSAFDNELPQHEVKLPRYFIGRYPVTVAQFPAFVEGGDP